MTVAVISALQTELDLVIESLVRVRGGSIAGWASWQGEYRDTPVVAARAGLGKVNTAALAALLWERHRPELMVFTGVAGGLDPDLAVGDMVIGERTIQYDAGTSRRPVCSVIRPGTSHSTTRLTNSVSPPRHSSSTSFGKQSTMLT
jgi:5'-methylthioadenosine/S-adenosylhomocysteine nucleosidase